MPYTDKKRKIIDINELFKTTEGLPKQGMCGVLAQYANPELIEKEKSAWESVAAEKEESIIDEIYFREK